MKAEPTEGSFMLCGTACGLSDTEFPARRRYLRWKAVSVLSAGVENNRSVDGLSDTMLCLKLEISCSEYSIQHGTAGRQVVLFLDRGCFGMC